jgi:predicted DNA-binding ribbon-helix-helix protein
MASAEPRPTYLNSRFCLVHPSGRASWLVTAAAEEAWGKRLIVDIEFLGPEVRERTDDGMAEDLTAWTSQVFRTVGAQDARKGFRLETAIWEGIAVVSQILGLKRSALVSRVSEAARSRELNTASALRVFVVQKLLGEVERLRRLNDTSMFISLLQQAPVPAFAVDRDKRLVRVNLEFNRFIRALVGGVQDPNAKANLHVNLETPIADIFEVLGDSGEYYQTSINVSYAGRVNRVGVKLVAVPPADPKVLVGYVTR